MSRSQSTTSHNIPLCHHGQCFLLLSARSNRTHLCLDYRFCVDIHDDRLIATTMLSKPTAIVTTRVIHKDVTLGNWLFWVAIECAAILMITKLMEHETSGSWCRRLVWAEEDIMLVSWIVSVFPAKLLSSPNSTSAMFAGVSSNKVLLIEHGKSTGGTQCPKGVITDDCGAEINILGNKFGTF